MGNVTNEKMGAVRLTSSSMPSESAVTGAFTQEVSAEIDVLAGVEGDGVHGLLQRRLVVDAEGGGLGDRVQGGVETTEANGLLSRSGGGVVLGLGGGRGHDLRCRRATARRVW